MFCSNCGTSYDDNAAFCPNCGAANPAAAQTAAPVQPNPYAQQVPPVQPDPYAQQPYGAPAAPYGAPYGAPVAAPSKGMSIAALVCGILGIVGSFFYIGAIVTLILSILGIIFGVKGMKQAKEQGGAGKGLATAGLVCGIVGAVFSGIGTICAICILIGIGSMDYYW